MDLSTEENGKKIERDVRIYFLRQLLSCSTVVLNLFILGLYMGANTVIVPQLRKEANSTDAVTPEMASWLSSASSYCAVPWIFILSMLAYRFGRKPCLIITSLNVLIGNILFYCSTTITDLIISQCMQGILAASIGPITIMVMSEYTSPRYRGIILTLKIATFFWGIWISNAIGTFFHWRKISIVIFVCSSYNLIFSIFGYESPYWLATKGRFVECAKVHQSLKGTDEDSNEELRKLILSEQENSSYRTKRNGTINVRNFRNIMNIIRQELFYKPLVYASLPIILYNATGKIACTIYSIDIIKKITASERMAYESMLILDAVTVVGMYLGSALTKVVTRRKQLLIFSCIGISFLYGLTVYLYMIKLDFVSENNYVTLLFLTGFTISIGCGPIILASCCAAELTPLKHRCYFLCFLSIMTNAILAANIKLSPLLFKFCGTAGAFLFHSVSSSVTIFVLYKYLPETKDLTIQEIQENIAKGCLYKLSTRKTESIPLKQPVTTR